jgi:FMN reductase
VADEAGALLRAALADAEGVALPTPAMVDLAALAPGLLGRWDLGVRGSGRDPAVDAARTVCGADVLLAVSPTFKGAYSGLLKHFLDLLPRDGLESTVAVPLMTAGLPRHRSAVDGTLRPLLLELQARVPAEGLCLLESQLGAVAEVFAAWWQSQGPDLGRAVLERVGGPERRVVDA